MYSPFSLNILADIILVLNKHLTIQKKANSLVVFGSRILVIPGEFAFKFIKKAAEFTIQSRESGVASRVVRDA